MKKILCIESLAGSFENCKKLGIDNKIIKELRYFGRKQGSACYLSKDVRKFCLGKNVRHIPLPAYTPSYLKNFVYLLYPFFNLSIFREYDTYYVHNISGSFPAVIAKFMLRNKRIISKYDWNWGFTFKQKYNYSIYLAARFLEYLSLKNSDLVIASTYRLRNEIYLITKDTGKNVAVIPNWVDGALFKPLRKKTINKRRPLLVSVGRLDEGKNHMLLLQSVKKLDSINPKVLLIGDGEQKDELLDYAEKNNIDLCIINKVPNVKIPQYLRKADLFLITSRYEGQPQVIIEALACGLPVIGLDVRGVNDIIKHNYNGILCKEDPTHVASALKSLLKNKRIYDQLRQNGIKSVKDYSFNIVMDKIYKHIKNEN